MESIVVLPALLTGSTFDLWENTLLSPQVPSNINGACMTPSYLIILVTIFDICIILSDYGLPYYRKEEGCDDEEQTYRAQMNRIYLAPECIQNPNLQYSQAADVYR